MSYRLAGNYVQRLSDGALIPVDPKNQDYIAYQRWTGDGNVAEPASTLPPREAARAAIAALELDQVRRLTARGDREFRIGVYEALATLPGLSALLQAPSYVALKALDTAIRAERVKL